MVQEVLIDTLGAWRGAGQNMGFMVRKIRRSKNRKIEFVFVKIIQEQMETTQIKKCRKFVACYIHQGDLEIFGKILFFPPIRTLPSSVITLMKNKLEQQIYFGLDLKQEFCFPMDSEFERRQKNSLQRHIASFIDGQRMGERKILAKRCLKSSPEQIKRMLGDRRLRVSPHNLYNEISKTSFGQISNNSEISEFLGQIDFQHREGENLIKSRQAEEDFQTILRSFGLSFKTEEILKKEYFDAYGHIPQHQRTIHPVTPDILLDEPIVVFLENKYYQVHWIEFKNYFGAPIGHPYKNTIAQLGRYVNKFGPGAITYALGASSDLKFEGCVVLDFYLE